MNYPRFYDELEMITLQDGLADFLGALESGIMQWSYLDAVKIAGHSCPTVMGTYLMLQIGLKTLYAEKLPLRGDIKIAFSGAQNEGVIGVMANLATAITGATSDFGFKGLGGKFNRCELLEFNANFTGTMRITSLQLKKSVILSYDTSMLPKNPELSVLMQKAMTQEISANHMKAFHQLWQESVLNVFQHQHLCISINTPNHI